jgi:NAD(P)-dependent dehydrogenase (short-subunit alcohol dehydrogenase family)
MDLFSLAGKTAVVTGGASGIGAATVQLFQQCGAEVTVLDIADGCDVTDERAVAQQFARLGAFDILVNSAGRAVRKPATELSGEEWDQVLDLNLKATFFCSRAAVPCMKKRGGGSIVNLTRALALEWAADNIRVNAVAPTFVRTQLTVPIFSNPDVLKAVMCHTPLNRLPEPEEIAAAIVYLCSPAAHCITGITLPVDSGYLAR